MSYITSAVFGIVVGGVFSALFVLMLGVTVYFSMKAHALLEPEFFGSRNHTLLFLVAFIASMIVSMNGWMHVMNKIFPSVEAAA